MHSMQSKDNRDGLLQKQHATRLYGCHFVHAPALGDASAHEPIQTYLTSPPDSRVMFFPSNQVRHSECLSSFPRTGQNLACKLHKPTILAKLIGRNFHILGRSARPGFRESQAALLGPGSVLICPFLFAVWRAQNG